MSVCLHGEPVVGGRPIKLGFLAPDTAVEHQLVRELLLSRLRDAGLRWGPGVDNEAYRESAFGVCREDEKALVWLYGVQCADGLLDVILQHGGHYFWAHNFINHPQAGGASAEIEKLWKEAALTRFASLAKRWVKQGGTPVFGLTDHGGDAVTVRHPKSGRLVSVTYLDFACHTDVIAEGWEDVDVIRSPRTNPRISTSTKRRHLRVKDLAAKDAWALASALALSVGEVEADNEDHE